MVYVFLIDNFEEIEALATVDILRRAEIPVTTVGIFGDTLCGSHNISVKADKVFSECSFSDAEALILPGGMGSLNFLKHDGLCTLLKQKSEEGTLLAAICAAPSVLGDLGLLNGYSATCYPGFEDHLKGAAVSEQRVCTDGKRITARGPGLSDRFAFALIETLRPSFDLNGLRESMQYE